MFDKYLRLYGRYKHVNYLLMYVERKNAGRLIRLHINRKRGEYSDGNILITIGKDFHKKEKQQKSRIKTAIIRSS